MLKYSERDNRLVSAKLLEGERTFTPSVCEFGEFLISKEPRVTVPLVQANGVNYLPGRSLLKAVGVPMFRERNVHQMYDRCETGSVRLLQINTPEGNGVYVIVRVDCAREFLSKFQTYRSNSTSSSIIPWVLAHWSDDPTEVLVDSVEDSEDSRESKLMDDIRRCLSVEEVLLLIAKAAISD